MLLFLRTPTFQLVEHGEVIGENDAEITHIVRRIGLHQRGGLHRTQEVGIDLGGVEGLPIDIVERPVLAHMSLPR